MNFRSYDTGLFSYCTKDKCQATRYVCHSIYTNETGQKSFLFFVWLAGSSEKKERGEKWVELRLFHPGADWVNYLSA